MGNLPAFRISPSRPFLHTGVDYAGPFAIIMRKSRGQKAYKAYIAVFVCLSTRAVHSELVIDLSTESFLAVFKRFASCRGIPSDLYSNNGTNFQGAEKELSTTFCRIVNSSDLGTQLATDGTSWHFIPLAAPHFGDIWEAGVKSMKHHLRRVVGNHTLLSDEFATLLCQIEVCLNSRPISALTADPENFATLTPGHFLIGALLAAVPEESVLELQENRWSRYQRVRAMLEHFWQSWSRDYLHTLQQRTKWTRAHLEIKSGELVLLRNNLLPPSKWSLDRVVAADPGGDGHVRVRNKDLVFMRPIAQVCRLPVDCDSA
ncbi:uncharacterized protein [Linepithema humile]|uniref:uncharacterized protein n=1 Tax=Linepithema humile TaxID=83485 RepID=UPI00351F4E92